MLAAPAESLAAVVTDSARPLRRRLRWARSLRDLGERTPLARTTEISCGKGAPLICFLSFLACAREARRAPLRRR